MINAELSGVTNLVIEPDSGRVLCDSIHIRLAPHYLPQTLEINQSDEGEIMILHHAGDGIAPECVFSIMPEAL